MRTEYIHIRISPEAKSAFKARCEKAGKSMSDTLIEYIEGAGVSWRTEEPVRVPSVKANTTLSKGENTSSSLVGPARKVFQDYNELSEYLKEHPGTPNKYIKDIGYVLTD